MGLVDSDLYERHCCKNSCRVFKPLAKRRDWYHIDNKN